MDITKISTIPECGSLPAASRGKVVVGAKQLRKAVQSGRARCVFLAKNADPAVTQPIEVLCAQRNIPITWVPGMAELGHSCGIEVGAAAAAVVD